jgi:RNase P subunit RPR2
MWAGAPKTPLLDQVFQASLPRTNCAACHHAIPRRTHRMTLRASWREAPETICLYCWKTICEWARRFALEQIAMDLDD